MIEASQSSLDDLSPQDYYSYLLSKWAKELKEQGYTEGELTREQMIRIMPVVIAKVLNSEKMQTARIRLIQDLLTLNLENGQLKFASVVHLQQPVKANLTMDCAFGNNQGETNATSVRHLALLPSPNPNGRMINFADMDSALSISQLAPILGGNPIVVLNEMAKKEMSDVNRALFKSVQAVLQPQDPQSPTLLPREKQLDPQSMSLLITPKNTVFYRVGLLSK